MFLLCVNYCLHTIYHAPKCAPMGTVGRTQTPAKQVCPSQLVKRVRIGVCTGLGQGSTGYLPPYNPPYARLGASKGTWCGVLAGLGSGAVRLGPVVPSCVIQKMPCWGSWGPW